jgi:predicted nucleotidyltransferase component of viral defense system
MPLGEVYRRQVQLLVRTLPLVAQEECFALKCGTAINLFYRNLPRLSVDIDLAYLPLANRAQSLAEIDAALRRIGERIRESDSRIRVQESAPGSQTEITRLVVRTLDGVQIKIEVTPVLRGVVYAPEKRLICERAETEYGFAEMSVLSFPDLYAGKCIAALDRQHPRDLFDVHELLGAEGITPELRTALIVYLISHGRPPHRLLLGKCRDITHDYEHGFQGMTATDLPIDALCDVHARLVEDCVTNMPGEHRAFLYGFFQGAPEWGLLGVPGCQDLPAVRWRQIKLAEAPEDERAEIVERLREVLG